MRITPRGIWVYIVMSATKNGNFKWNDDKELIYDFLPDEVRKKLFELSQRCDALSLADKIVRDCPNYGVLIERIMLLV